MRIPYINAKYPRNELVPGVCLSIREDYAKGFSVE
jgi:hypothetical protein